MESAIYITADFWSPEAANQALVSARKNFYPGESTQSHVNGTTVYFSVQNGIEPEQVIDFLAGCSGFRR